MIYVMKQRLFSWGDDFVIKDETGHDRFFVDGKAFSLGNQLSFQDSSGTPLAHISQPLASVHKKTFTFIHCTFAIEGEGANHLHAVGDFTDHNYVFTRDEQPVAQVSKQWFALSDTLACRLLPARTTS